MDKWDKRFMEMADLVAGWASCYQENRKIGAVIVRNKRVITTGYNGAPAGIRTCMERGECLRRKMNIPSGTQQEYCYAIHAEQNAIIQAAKLGISIEGSTLYCTHQPCVICAKMIVNSGISRVVYREGYPDEFARVMLSEGGVTVEKFLSDPMKGYCEKCEKVYDGDASICVECERPLRAPMTNDPAHLLTIRAIKADLITPLLDDLGIPYTKISTTGMDFLMHSASVIESYRIVVPYGAYGKCREIIEETFGEDEEIMAELR